LPTIGYDNRIHTGEDVPWQEIDPEYYASLAQI
jgi:hypothetical protein